MSVLSGVIGQAARDLSATFMEGDQDIQIVGAGHSFYVALSEVSDRDGFALDYESNEDLDGAFRREVLAFRFYSIRYNDFGAAKRVLFDLLSQLDALGMDSWIDTDHGWVIRGTEAMAHMSREPGWDWRKPWSSGAAP